MAPKRLFEGGRSMDINKVVNWFRFKNAADLRVNETAEELTQLKLMKLLYLAQGVSLAAFDQKIFPDSIVAWKYGPAVESVHYRFDGKRTITGEMTKRDFDDYHDVLKDEKTTAVLEAVYSTYGDMSASDLVKLTHSQAPWKETEQSQVIDENKLKEYFKENVLAHGKK